MPTAQREAAPKLRGLHCLVLGGGGFIGTNLCRALALREAEVHAFGRRQSYPEGLDGIRWTQGDFADRAALARAIEGQDVLFHLVGGSIPESSNADPIADLIGSTLPSLHLLGICQAYGIRKIVFVSSGGTVYGIPSRIPINEGAPTDPISAYGVSKLRVEKYLNLHRYLYNLDSVVLRVANPYGPFQNPTRRQGVVSALLRRVLDGQPVEVWGSGEVIRDFIYVDDVVNGFFGLSPTAAPERISEAREVKLQGFLAHRSH